MLHIDDPCEAKPLAEIKVLLEKTKQFEEEMSERKRKLEEDKRAFVGVGISSLAQIQPAKKKQRTRKQK